MTYSKWISNWRSRNLMSVYSMFWQRAPFVCLQAAIITLSSGPCMWVLVGVWGQRIFHRSPQCLLVHSFFLSIWHHCYSVTFVPLLPSQSSACVWHQCCDLPKRCVAVLAAVRGIQSCFTTSKEKFFSSISQQRCRWKHPLHVSTMKDMKVFQTKMIDNVMSYIDVLK